MNTKKHTLLLAIATAGLVSLSACKSNQTQQQSSSMPSSGSPSSGGPSMPSSSSGSSGSSRPTVSTSSSIPGGASSGLPSPGLPSPGAGFPSPGFPSAGTPGSSMPGTPGAETGQSGSQQSGSQQGGQNGSEGRDGFPNDESPFPAGDADGDGVPDTAQPGDTPYDDVDFSESSGGGGSASSREERMASLDEELEGSMRDYDGRILEERAGVMGRANASGSEAQLEEFDRSVSYYDEADDPGNEPPPPIGTSEPSGEQPRGLPTSGRSQDIVTAPPDDIPSGDDDDVVARQIREAAMKERDPDLREALWEEYRKYKNQ